jgi:peptide/nickel transport system permease protein
MRYALRRLLWVLPALGLTAIVAFWAVTLLAEREDTVSRFSHLPRFVNRAPRDVRVLSLWAMTSIASSTNPERGKAELARLGGACLPHVLTRLDALPPAERARVAQALTPLARRMGIATEELETPEGAVLFWQRFWQDRAIDYRPLMVRRLVRSFAERALALREDAVIELDTFAVPYLIDALSTVRSRADLDRAERVTAILSHVTGNPWRVSGGASLAEARAAAREWREWWAVQGMDYVALDGPRRMSAVVTETQFGKWIAGLWHGRLGQTASGTPVLDVLRERLPITLSLVAAGLFGTVLLVLVGVLFVEFLPRRQAVLLRAVSWAVAALPAAAVAGWLSGLGAASFAAAALGMALLGAATASRTASPLLAAQPSREQARGFLLGASVSSTLAARLRRVISRLLARAATDLPLLLLAAFVFERACSLPGIGAITVAAVHHGDVDWLMAVGLGSAAAAALANVLSDTLLAVLEPEASRSLLQERGDRG